MNRPTDIRLTERYNLNKAKVSGTVSPIAMDISTPNNSPSASVSSWSWPPDKLQILTDYSVYASQLEVYINSALTDGPFTRREIPKRPKSRLEDLFKLKRNKAVPITGMALHKYMESQLVNLTKNIQVRQWDPTSLETMKTTLQDGYSILKKHGARSLGHYLKFGKILNLAFDFFTISKIRNDLPEDMTWNKWLSDNVNLSVSYDRDLRSLANQFGRYKRFQYLGMSMNEFKNCKERIRLMFSEFPHLVNFWEQDIEPQ